MHYFALLRGPSMYKSNFNALIEQWNDMNIGKQFSKNQYSASWTLLYSDKYVLNTAYLPLDEPDNETETI